MQGAGRRRLYLMRHGHVDYFAPGLTDPRSVPLTDQGREQAAAAREALADIDFDIAVNSGLPRTVETLNIVLSERQKKPPIWESQGLEELKSGWIEAESRESLAAILAFSFDSAGENGARFLPDGEYFADAETRIIAALDDMIKGEPALNQQWRTALIVAHEGVNRIILGWLSGGGLKSVASFEQDLCCINVIDIDVVPNETGTGLQLERAVLKSINVTPYDYLKQGLPRTSLEHLFGVDFGHTRPRQNFVKSSI